MFSHVCFPCYPMLFFHVLSLFSPTFHHWDVLSNFPVRIVPDVNVVWVSEFDLVVAVPAQQLIHRVLGKALLGDKRENPAKRRQFGQKATWFYRNAKHAVSTKTITPTQMMSNAWFIPLHCTSMWWTILWGCLIKSMAAVHSAIQQFIQRLK